MIFAARAAVGAINTAIAIRIGKKRSMRAPLSFIYMGGAQPSRKAIASAPVFALSQAVVAWRAVRDNPGLVIIVGVKISAFRHQDGLDNRRQGMNQVDRPTCNLPETGANFA